MEIDHIFICVQPGAPEAEALVQFGLVEGSGNTHPGQGTANRRFFFDNAFIELLWLVDAAEACSATTRPTLLFERLTAGGAAQVSPFGVCFRPSSPGETTAPFPSWQYRPAYLPPGLAVDVAGVPPSEPMWFFLAFGGRPDAAPPERRQPLQPPGGLRRITSVRVTSPACGERSDTGGRITGGVEMLDGAAHLLEIGFDDEGAARSHDFRPALPLLLRW